MSEIHLMVFTRFTTEKIVCIAYRDQCLKFGRFEIVLITIFILGTGIALVWSFCLSSTDFRNNIENRIKYTEVTMYIYPRFGDLHNQV